MTISPEEGLSPAEEWLRRGQMTPVEATLGEAIAERGASAEDLAGAALGIGAAFVLYRRYMSRRLREETAGQTLTQAQLIRKVADTFGVFAPRWALLVVPALISGYRQGLREAGSAELSPEWLANTANAYAMVLGEHMHEVSAQALVEGYQAQINRRIAARVALDRVIDAYGVAPRTMKTLVGIWSTPPDPQAKVVTSAPMRNRTLDRVDSLVADALQRRASDIGQTEAYSIKAQAKQLLWLQAWQEGHLPRNTVKEWVTADDERVCPTCGPLHRKTVAIDEQFLLPGNVKVWGPALHPNCRCDMRLQIAALLPRTNFRDRELAVAKSVWGVVSKARGTDPYDRDKNGRFAAVESRPAKPKVADPRVVRLLQDHAKQNEETVSQTLSRLGLDRQDVKKPELRRTDLTSGKRELKRTSLSRSSLSREMPKAEMKSEMPKREMGKAKFTAKDFKLNVRDLQSRRPMPPAAQQTSDKWINTPDGKPMFGVFWDQGLEHLDSQDRSLLIADEETPFYLDEAMEYGRGGTLAQGIMDYWDMRVFDDLQFRFENHDNYDEGTGMLSFHDQRSGVTTFIPEETWEVAWREAVAADASPFEASEVEVFEVDAKGEHRAVLMNAFDVGDKLGIHDEVAYLTPLVGVANKFNAIEGEENFPGIASNPGKWRITGVYPHVEYEGYLPYKIVYIEPEDLF